MKTTETKNISVSIGCPLDFGYDFLHRPENFPTWASGLCKSIRKVGNDWIAETPQGQLKISFTEWNKFGILDHLVHVPNGIVYVSMRIIPNFEGSEIVFTLFRPPGMTDQQFTADAELVQRDLNEVKQLLERLYGRQNKGEAAYA